MDELTALNLEHPQFKSKCQSYGPALWIKVETPNPILFRPQMLCLHTYKKKQQPVQDQHTTLHIG